MKHRLSALKPVSQKLIKQETRVNLNLRIKPLKSKPFIDFIEYFVYPRSIQGFLRKPLYAFFRRLCREKDIPTIQSRA